MASPIAEQSAERAAEMPGIAANTSKQQQATTLFQEKQFAEAARLLTELLAAEETAELWNDWATVQFALGHITEAEHGFRRAKELSPSDAQICENLGALLAGRLRLNEAIALLEKSVAMQSESGPSTAKTLLANCQKQLLEWVREFQASLSEPAQPLGEVPRWPLDALALHLARRGDLVTAFQVLGMNLHFSSDHRGMIKMRESIQVLLDPSRFQHLQDAIVKSEESK